MGEPERRRRRLRPSHGSAAPAPSPAVDETAGPAAGAAVTEPIADPVPEETAAPAPAPVERMVRPPRNGNGRRPVPGPGAGGDDRELERGLRGLVGSGSSQVSVGAAMRARDAARPTEQDLADADRNLTIVRRNWVPREELPRNR